ncbi:MAG: immunoglobulin-like domain-containing protein, partial [Verrucomicrobiia bacterium]
MKNEEKNEEATDSTIEDTSVEESQSEATELNPKHRTIALSSLAAGYALALGFGALLLLGTDDPQQVTTDDSVTEEGELVAASEGADGESSVITLAGGTSIPWPVGKLWVDPGYTAIVGDEDLTAFVETASFVDVNTPGQYRVIYTIKDSKTGNVM